MRARARRLLKSADADVLAQLLGVTRGTVQRWRRKGAPAARVEQMVSEVRDGGAAALKRAPSKPRQQRRESPRSTVWDAGMKGPVVTKLQAANVATKLLGALKETAKRDRFPKGATYQWVIRGVSTHTPEQYIKGAYHPTELRARGKKLRTSVVLLPDHAFGRLDVCASSLAAKLANLPPFFQVRSVNIMVRKARRHA